MSESDPLVVYGSPSPAFDPARMTREDTLRLSALDMAIRHAEAHPDYDMKVPDKITKTAELFRRFLSGEPWPTM